MTIVRNAPFGAGRSAPELLRWCESIGFRLLLWERQGADPKQWKGPHGAAAKGWNAKDRVYDISEYTEQHNVGTFTGHEITPGRFLADVDFDWDGPDEIKKKLLPDSGFGFGRPSKTLSHAFYTTSQQIPSVARYVDIDGQTLVELFGGDSTEQTMIPPSPHSPGELLEFREQEEPSHVADLVTGVRDYAICCLLYRHFGHRQLLHEPRLALSGLLLRHGVSEDVVVAIGQIICKHAGNDGDGKDVERTVCTAQKLRADQKVLGGPMLSKTFGDEGQKLIDQIRHWIQPDADSLVLNPNDPMPSARRFVAGSHTVKGVLALRHQNSVFYAYAPTSNAYLERDEASVRAELYRFLETAKRIGTDDAFVPFQPTKGKVKNVLDALRAVCNLSAVETPPCWLEKADDPPPLDLLACSNACCICRRARCILPLRASSR